MKLTKSVVLNSAFPVQNKTPDQPRSIQRYVFETEPIASRCNESHGDRINNNDNDNNSYIALYTVKIYKLAALYIINIKIRLTIKKVQVL